MWIKQLQIVNLRCFEGQNTLEFSKAINLFTGENSSGKSTLLKAIGLPEAPADIKHAARKGAKKAEVILQFEDQDDRSNAIIGITHGARGTDRFKYDLIDGSNTVVSIKSPTDGGWSGPIHCNFGKKISASNNIYFPYLSRRKAKNLEETLDAKTKGEIHPDFRNLYAKLTTLTSTGHPRHQDFERACKDIIGHPIHNFASDGGMQAGLQVSEDEAIALTEMGEGVLNILGLLVDLFGKPGRIFLIEELENDLHPEALKKLLDIILENVGRHQFFISTHSSIVLRHLSSHANTRIFDIKAGMKERAPTSTIQVIENRPENTYRIATRLGADLMDSWLFDGYLILEESSAESVIRDILIRLHVPSLNGRLRTVSTKGTGNLKQTYASAQSLFLFAHLSPIYAKRCWVWADGEKSGEEAIDTLKKSFPKAAEQFSTFSEKNFERYYPARFSNEINAALSIQDKAERGAKKGELLKQVLKWAHENPVDAKVEFGQSAAEIIDKLKSVEACLDGLNS